ncbi:MAG TPA: sigma-70 family RNA polymerase sigma factor [Polyangiales bacterium]|nr:sigma-70 family RNA polymerase sigma factor [Polyangiales bacterium]
MSAESAAAVARNESEAVVLQALAGDLAAERELCRRLLPAVRAFAQRRLRSSSVDDFAHDALLLLVEALRAGRIQDASRVAGFALGICRNLARERARTGERRRELSAQYGISEADLSAWDAQLSVRREHLEDCFSQLTERARRVIRATFCEEELDGDIARSLSITEANVRIIRHRSIHALRTCLERPISWVSA